MVEKAKDEEKIDPKENDKCMDMENEDIEKQNIPSKWDERVNSLKKQANDIFASRLKTIILILAIILFILFIIIIVLAFSLQRGPPPEPLLGCSQPNCILAAATIGHNYNRSFDPCSDFWEYACEGWIQKHPLGRQKGSVSVHDMLQDKIDQRLRGLIDIIPQDEQDPSPLRKLKDFFTTCMKVEDLEYMILVRFKRVINEIGGWRLLPGWQQNRWDRNEILGRVHSDYAIDAFFNIDIDRDDTQTRNIIKLSPAGLTLPNPQLYLKSHNDKFVTDFKDYISNIVRILGVEHADAQRFAEDMFYFEKRIALITPSASSLRDRASHYKVFTISELTTLSPSIKWLGLLQTYFPNAGISKSTRVGIVSESYFQDLSQLISTTDDLALNDYLMWRLVSENAQHFSKDFRGYRQQFDQIFEGVESPERPTEERWRFCVRMMDKYLGHAMGHLYINKYFPQAKIHGVREMVDHVLSTLVGQVNSISWLKDQSEREIMQEKIRELKIHTGFPDWILERTTLENYYAPLKVTINYFSNIFEANYLLRRKKEDLLKEHSKFTWKDSSQEIKARYFYNGNQLTISAALLEEPYYKPGLPLAISYGSLAKYLAPTILELMDDTGVQYQQGGLLLPWLSNSSYALFNKRTSTCLNYTATYLPIDSDPQLNDVITDIVALRVAYRTFQRLSKHPPTQQALPVIKVNSDQLFFLSYAQAQCQTTSLRKAQMLAQSEGKLTNQYRLEVVLNQMPEFSEAFNCPRKVEPQCHPW